MPSSSTFRISEHTPWLNAPSRFERFLGAVTGAAGATCRATDEAGGRPREREFFNGTLGAADGAERDNEDDEDGNTADAIRAKSSEVSGVWDTSD